jgi:hypothetical protein
VFVVGAAAVSGRDEEVPFRPELQLPAVVVVVFRVRDRRDHVPQAGERRAVAAGGHFGDVDLARAVGVVEEELAGRVEVGGERDREQAALAVLDDHRAQVGERLQGAVFKQRDRPFAFDHEEPFRIARIGGDIDRLFEAAADRLQGERLGAARQDDRRQRADQY